MICQDELPGYMGEALPELSSELCDKEKCKNVYSTIHVLVDHTNEEIVKGNIGRVKKYFSVAEKLYDKGDDAVKKAIENVYVFSLSHFLSHDSRKRDVLIGLLPVGLYTIYLGQMINSHI